MKLVVHISGERIRVILGSGLRGIRIQSCFSAEGEEELKDILGRLAGSYPYLKNRVIVVLGGGWICHKLLDFPAGEPFRSGAWMKSELNSLYPGGKEMVWDYELLQRTPDVGPERTGLRRLFHFDSRVALCVGMDREFLDHYLRLFENCGLQIGSLQSSFVTTARVFGNLPELRQKTYIAVDMDGDWTGFFYYVRNRLVFAGRKPGSGVRGSREFGEWIARELALLCHFHNTFKDAGSLDGIYISGLYHHEETWLPALEKELEVSVKIMRKSRGIRVAQDSAFRFQDYSAATGALLRARPYNLVSAMGRRARVARNWRERMASAALILWAAFFVVYGIYGAYEANRLNARQIQIRRERFGLEQNEFWQAQQKLREETAVLKKRRREEQSLHEQADGCRSVSGDYLTLLAEPGKDWMEIAGVHYENGVMKVEAVASDYHPIPGYVQALKGTQGFHEVVYSGFERMPGTGDARYRFRVEFRWER